MEKTKNCWVIPTDKPSRILFDKEENRLLPLQDSTVFMQYQDLVENQHIYITNDEEIKEGDYVISTYDKWRGDGKLKPQIGEMLEIHNDYYLIDSFNGDTNNRWDKGHSKKIILTTDKDLDGIQAIDDEFLNWFVKNSSCERVEIRYTVDFNSKAVIIIPKEEPKQVTLEEVAEEYAISKSSSSVFQKAHIRDFIAGAKWQQERMYSEEDLREAYIAGCKNPLLYKTHEEKAIDWYKQYKK